MQEEIRRINKSNSSSISPQNTIFAFDFHDVVAHPNLWEMLSMLFLTWDGWFFIGMALNPFIFISIFLWLFYRGKPLVTEELWFYLVKRHSGLHSATPFFIQLANTFTLDPSTSLVIQKLKSKNYQVFLFSNIGGTFWKDMVVKHKDLFEPNFDGFCVASEEEDYLSKPNPIAYSNFLKRFNPENKRVFFVDDKFKNIVAGSQSTDHFFGYEFQTGEKLLQDLLEWKILD